MRILEYVQQREGEYYVGTTRVTLRSIVADWKRGRTPEKIVADFPAVTLVEVFGAITSYLEHHQELDAQFQALDREVSEARATAEAANPAFYADMRARMARVRPRIEAELRAQGILSEASSESEPSEDQENAPEAPTA